MALKFKGKGKKITKGIAKSKKKLIGDLKITIDDGSLDRAADLVNDIKVECEAIASLNLDLTTEMDLVLGYVTDVDKEQKIILEGNSTILKLGAKGKTTQVTCEMQDLHEILGDEVFYAIANVGITNLKKYLTPEELADVTKTIQEGARSKKFLDKV